MKKIFILIILFNFLKSAFTWEIRLIERIIINQKDYPPLFSSFFALLEDGNFIFTDIKDREAQLKIYDQEGKLIKGWGKMGPGPDEFGGLFLIDYQSPYLAVLDAQKHSVYILEKLEGYNFKKIGQILCWEANNPLKIYKNYVIMGGYIVSKKGEKYILFMRDFKGQKTIYLLPLDYQYGTKSTKDYKEVQERVSGFSQMAFIDIYEDTLFYISDVRLKVVKFNLKTKTIEVFGHESKNFRNLEMNKRTKDDLLNPQLSRQVAEELLTKFSFVAGIFADKDILGVLFVNREKRIDNQIYFVPYVQLYDHEGNFLFERKIDDFYSEENYIPLFYQKKEKNLYLLSMVSDKYGINYIICKYALQ
jgi:hypothetical protein